jgi:hypothetical protein
MRWRGTQSWVLEMFMRYPMGRGTQQEVGAECGIAGKG